ncbi:hypothetical protein H5410_036659 [Solanum commersonii]|uniref:At2g35280-like TPR domain-containing protein n=1 Tax=Solanum commersonii TaxID=4109 RepID=A0A9J5Y458_SOLCO|nr:hypothetical protein H5410_036659 [Solanum commersonii]
MWVPEPHLLGERPICCTVHQPEQIARKNGWPRGSDDEDDIRCELCNLMNVKLRVLNQVASEPSVYQKVTLVDFTKYIWPCNPWSFVLKCTSFLEMCKSSGNLEALYSKGVVDYFHHGDPNALGMLNQATDGGDIGASYVLAIISIFKGSESMREGLIRVPEPHLLGERFINSITFIVNYENSCNFFRWRDREDVDIRSKFIILRLANRIKELEINDESHIKRSNKWVMKEKKKTKCCNNWKLIFLFNTLPFEAYVTTYDPYVTTYETYVATDDLFVATDASNVVTYHPYVETLDHLRHMLLHMRHILLQMTYLFLHITLM